MRVAHEEGPPYNPGASLALAFGVPRITHFHDLLQIRIDPRAATSRSIIVEFAQYHQGKDLNIAGYTDVTEADVVSLRPGMLVSTEMGK